MLARIFVLPAAAAVAVAVCMCAGCYHYDPVNVVVRDANTREPLPGARVCTGYETGMFHSGPRIDCQYTGANGVAVLRVADDPYGVVILVHAMGYQHAELPIFPEGGGYRSAGEGSQWKPIPWPPARQTVELEPLKPRVK